MGKFRKDDELRSLYMGYLDDGILDLYIGLILLFAGLMLFTDMVWMAGIYVAIFLPAVWSFKEKVTYPRVRPEEIKPVFGRQSRVLVFGLALGLLLAAAAGAALFFLFANKESGSVPWVLIVLVSFALVALPVLAGFLLMAARTQAPRWYVYAGTVAASAVAVWQLDIGLPWAIIAVGGVITLGGTICLVRFIRSHPVLPNDEQTALNS